MQLLLMFGPFLCKENHLVRLWVGLLITHQYLEQKSSMSRVKHFLLGNELR